MSDFDLGAYLEQRGLADTDGVRRAARYGRCPHCHVPVLIGLDADLCALPRMCDVTDLDRCAELLVLAAGGSTLRVLEIGGRLQLARRGPEAIRADRQDRPVVAEHACGRPAPPSTAFRWRIPPAPGTTTDDPPF